MYHLINQEAFRNPGDYQISDVYLSSYQDNGGNIPKRVNIRGLIAEINIFENIMSDGLTGNIAIVDTTDLVTDFPITGHEHLEFKLRTPSIPKGYDFTSETGHPMIIYKVEQREEISPRSQAYLLHFCSKEMLMNKQKRINTHFNGNISEIVEQLFLGDNNLNSKKSIFIEQTRGVHEMVMPNKRPFETIRMLGEDAQSAIFNNSGYLFYETSLGYHFRSLESLFSVSSDTPRPVVAKYTRSPAAVYDNRNVKDIRYEMQVIQDYNVRKQSDTLKLLNLGYYANKLYTVDTTNKSYQIHNFNSEENYNRSSHTDEHNPTPFYINEQDRPMSEQYDGRVYLKANTRNVFNNTDLPYAEDILQKRKAQSHLLNSFECNITTHGFTGINAGDMVALSIPAHKPYSPKDEPRDLKLSGRYVISKLRHQISVSNRKHTTTTTLLKDGVFTPQPSSKVNTYQETNNNRSSINLNDFDETTLTNFENI